MEQFVIEFVEPAWAFTRAHATILGVLSLLTSLVILASPVLGAFAGRRSTDNDKDNDVVASLAGALAARQPRLLVSAVDLEEAAAAAGVGVTEAASAVARVAEREPRLRSTVHEGRTLLYFCTAVGVPVALPGAGWAARRAARRRAAAARRRIERLAAERAKLAYRREQLENAAAAMEERAGRLRTEFAAAVGETARGRIASDLACVRRDAGRRLALADVVRTQYEIAASAIQSLRLTLQGEATSPSDGEQLAEAVARAEAASEELNDRSDTTAAVDAQLRQKLSAPADESRLFDELSAESHAERSVPSSNTSDARPPVVAAEPVSRAPPVTDDLASNGRAANDVTSTIRSAELA